AARARGRDSRVCDWRHRRRLHRTRALRNTRIKGPLQSTRIPSQPLRLIRHTTIDKSLTGALTGRCCLSLVSKCSSRVSVFQSTRPPSDF
ncbi:hypothetical protein T492DRAFT_916441, partial [Pavlovales sp. CCMP2436]